LLVLAKILLIYLIRFINQYEYFSVFIKCFYQQIILIKNKLTFIQRLILLLLN
jgi:hypothetical protein